MDTPVTDGNQPLVSVIIPAYNAEAYLAETVRSVQAQTYTNWELIIVNDGATDGTESVARAFAAEDARIRSIHKSNSGVSDTRNAGFALASGAFIAFLDADDVWLPENLSAKITLLQMTGCGAVYSTCRVIDGKSTPTEQLLIGDDAPSLEDLFLLRGNYFTAPSGIVLQRKALEAAGLFDPQLSNNADQDLWMRLLANGAVIAYIDRELWLYRIHGNNMSGNIALLEKDSLYLLRKAERLGIFSSRSLRNQSFSRLYFMLAGSWWKQGNNKGRGLQFLLKAVLCHPPVVLKLLQR